MHKFLSAFFVYLLISLSVYADIQRDLCTSSDSERTSAFMACMQDAENTNHPVIQTFVGDHYYYGDGITQNYAEAIKWYRLAAEQGYADAQYNLGLMYANGEDVPEDKVLAYMWWNLAAANGNDGASKNKDIIAERMTSSQNEI